MLCNVKLIGKHNGRMIEQYNKALVFLDHVDGPYIFSMLLAFSGIFKTKSPLIQPSKFRHF